MTPTGLLTACSGCVECRTPGPPMKLVVKADKQGAPTILSVDERASVLYYTDEMDGGKIVASTLCVVHVRWFTC